MRPARASVALVGFLALVFFFRDFVASGFDRVPGGRADARLLIAILEHWRDVVLHGAPMGSPPFFAPERGVLGYSESMVLFAPPFIVCRLLGADRYLAFMGSLVVVKTIGFASMYLVLRRMLAADRFAAALGAALFTVSNAYWLALGHAQLMTVSFVPALVLLVHRWALTGALWALAAAALLLGLMLFTSFYIGWFAVFLGAILLFVIGLAAAGGAWGWRPRLTLRDSLRVLRDLLVALTVLSVTLLPLLSVYLPILAQTGGRTAEEVWLYLPFASDAWNVGPSNRLWGMLLERLWVRPPRYVFAYFEAARGWPPLTLAVFLATLAAAVSRVHGGWREGGSRWALVAGIAGTTAVAGWLATVRVGDFTVWRWVYGLLPGATAIRVPVRLNLVLNVLVVAVVTVGLSRIAAWRPMGRVAAALLAIGLIAEQWNVSPFPTMSRAAEREAFAIVRPAPPECRYFYVSNDRHDSNEEEDFLIDARRQVAAMLVALEQHVPTINGYSGGHPPGWDLDSNFPDYEARALRWAAAHGVADGLCRLELGTGRWSLARRAAPQ